MHPPAATLDNLGSLAQRLEVINADDRRTIFLNGYAVARYACDDKAAERVLVTQLAETLPLSDRQIAAAFQIHPVTLSRFRSVARAGGAAALFPGKSGPKGPSKMTPKIEARCRALRAQGLTCRAIAKKVSQAHLRISHVTVAALFKHTSALPQQQTLLPQQDTLQPESAPTPQQAPVGEQPLPPEPALSDQTEPATEGIEEAAGEGQHTRYAGAMMLYAALEWLGVWNVFSGLGANAGPSRRCGWAQTVASIVFCFALRFRSVEDWKNGLRRDLGVLIGESSAPSVLTVRTKVNGSLP